MAKHIVFILFVFFLGGCVDGRRVDSDSTTDSLSALNRQATNSDYSKHYIFEPTLPPAEFDYISQQKYLRIHYWDKLDFSDSLFFQRVDSLQMLSSFVRYLDYVISPNDGDAMRMLMSKASVTKIATKYFYDMGQIVLFDPNSPFRSDELYIPIAEAVVNSELFTEEEKAQAKVHLKIASQNRAGEPANDFRYTLKDGTTSRLYSLKSDWVLLFFSNPDCPMCKEVSETLNSSPLVNEMVERGELKILMLYPDSDLEAWHRYSESVPNRWIYAYDKGCKITASRSYDLRAIPSLYLLDREKRVVLKDVANAEYIEDRLNILR